MRFALLVFYAAGTLAVPVPDERIPKAIVTNIDCSSPFQPGTTTSYDYAGETLNQVEGTSTSYTGLRLQTKVSITALNEDCQFLMELDGTEISSKAMNEEDFTQIADAEAFQQNLEAYKLRFTMKGKQIVAVQSHKKETTEALNIKKGILSAFQLDEKATVETDINGECKTTISVDETGITKTKSLTECSKRARSEIGIQSASIKTDMDLKPLDSKSVCKYTLGEEGDIRSVHCDETHMFRPFSAGHKTPSGAMTIVSQQIDLTETLATNSEYVREHYTVDSSLTYQHILEDEVENKPNQPLSPVDEVMSRLISKSQLSAKETTAKDFTELVMLLRKMDEKMMKTIWDKYFDCTSSKVCEPDDMNMKDLYRQYMLDAIAYCGTPSCVSVVKDVTVSGEVSGERANTFLMSIAFVAKTTNGMIRDILDIAQSKPSRQVFMTLGTLINRHCTKSPELCKSGPVVDAENFLVKTLGKCTGQDNHERVEEIIMTLKAIGNAKRPENARKDLLKCGLETSHSNITLSAFNALRNMPCNEATLGDLNRMIADHSVDEEKRIYAFQTSMNCPTKLNLGELVRIYNAVDSRNSQLASFMWTYFTNLNESGNPSSKEAKEMLASIIKEAPLKETNMPIYSHSKNMEKSLYLDYLKSGVSAKANLVFNPENIIPKTASFEMTANVMGVPVDLVETVVGIDGVESLLDNVVLPEVFAFDMFKTNFAEKIQEMKEKKKVVDRIRRKTDVEVTKPKQFSGFMSMKVMGQELRVMSYDDIYAMIEEIDNMNVIQILSKIAKGGKKTFSKSMMFLEMTYTVPTGFGLPLKLKLTGTTVGSMEMDGKLDMRNMFWGPGALYVNGFFKPTAVVEITGKMGIESKYVSTGLLVSNNMMVSNMMKGTIQYKAGQILKINVDTPPEPVQLFKSSSTPYMYMNEKVAMMQGVPRVIKTDKCVKSQIIGYGLCTNMRIPVAFRDYEAPYFPLSGPAYLGLSLVRGDDKLSTFEFLMSMTKKADGLEGIIEFSTPGAVYERKLSGKMSYTDVDNKKVLTLSTEPFGKVGSLEFTYDGVSRSASVQAKNNFFTSKDILATVSIQNQTNAISAQYGIIASIQHDSYKFEHMTKYVKKATGHKFLSKTTYAPSKVISASLEYNREEKKLIAMTEASQFNQSVEVSAQLGSTADGEGLIFTATHVPTKKIATLFSGIKNEESKKEITFSLAAGGKTIKNTLGWYKNGDVCRVENFFSYDKKTAKFAAEFLNTKDEKSLKLIADVFGKTALSRVTYSSEGSMTVLEATAEALGKKATLQGELINEESLKSLVFNADVMGKKARSVIEVRSTNSTKTIEFSVEAIQKTAILQALWDNKAEEKTLKFYADVLGKQASTTMRYTTEDKGTKRSLKFSADIIGKQASTLFILNNAYEQKFVKMMVDIEGKTVDTAVGYFKEHNGIRLQLDGSYAGKTAKLFWKYENEGNFQSVFGFEADKYIGGVKSSYTKTTGKVSACSSIYYGLDTAAKEAIASCVEFNVLSKDQKSHWQGKISIDLPELKKKVELVSDLSKEVGLMNMLTKAIYNDKELCKYEVDVNYKDLSNSAAKLSANVGKYDVIVKAYTQKVNDAFDVRFEMSSMGKSLQFVNKYQKQGGLMKVTSEVSLNGKVLPISTLIAVQSDESITGCTLAITLGNYGLTYKSNVMFSGKYGWSSELLVMKEQKIILTLFNKVLATLIEAEKGIEQKFGFFLMEKRYEYGWSFVYSKQTLVAKLQYATKRAATVSIAFSNDADVVKVNAVVEYIPSKKVSHSISYNKGSKQMDISVEFLPKMFAKFMARLESKDGYQLITNAHFQWKNFDSLITTINSYVNTEDKLEFSIKFSDKTFAKLTYNKGLPKTLTLAVSVLGKNAVISCSYADKVISLQLDVNGKTVFKIQGDYNKISKMVSKKGNEIIAHFKDGYEKVTEDLKDVTSRMKKDLKEVISRMKKWATFKLRSKDEITTFTFKMFGKRVKKLVFNKEKRTLSIQYKSTAAISIAHLPETKAISITIKGKKSSASLILRADWDNLITSALVLVNKVNVAGVKIYMDKLGLNFKLIATPEFILNTIFSKTDNSLKMEINRIVNKVVTNEITLQYILNGKSSDFVFKWNKEALNKATEKIQGLVQPILAKLKTLAREITDGYLASYGTLKELSIEAKAELLKLMNKIDTAFDELDFMAIRDKIGAMTLDAIKKTSTVTYNALMKLASVIDEVNERLPRDIAKIKEQIKKIKPEIAVSKAKEIIGKVDEFLKKLEVNGKLEKVKNIVIKIVQTIIADATPVVEKAITLTKDFKIRGKRMEDIVKEVATKVEKYIKIYKEKADMQLNKLKVQLHETAQKITEYVLKLNVPYTNKTVTEVIELIKTKFIELREKVKSLDSKKFVAEMKAKILEYKVKGKTVKEHIAILSKKVDGIKTELMAIAGKYKDLPEDIRKALHALVAVQQKYVEKINIYVKAIAVEYEKVAEFAKPLVDYIEVVMTSIKKHYGPLYIEVHNAIVKELQKFDFVPAVKKIIQEKLQKISDFALPLVKPLVPLYKNLKEQIKSIKVEGMQIGSLVDNQIEKFDKAVEAMVTKAKAKLNEEMKMLTEMAATLKSSTADQIIDRSIDSSLATITGIVEYLNSVYSGRKELTSKYLQGIKEIYEKVKAHLKKLSTKPLAVVTEELIDTAIEKTISSGAEISSLLKQIAELNISNPSWKAWKEADIIGHLGKYGVNQKIRDIIKYAKDANMTKIVKDIISKIESIVIDTTHITMTKVLNDYKMANEKLVIVIEYVKSISKKDYDSWLAELKTFTTDAEQKLIQWVKDLYDSSEKRATDALVKVKELATADMTLAKDYVAVVQKWYNTIATKGGLVYAEVKQPTIDVYNHYNSKISVFVREKYAIIRAKVIAEFGKLYDQFQSIVDEMKAKLPELKEKLNAKATEMKAKVEKMFGELKAKYENMKWEEVMTMLKKLYLEEYEKVKAAVVTNYELGFKEVIQLKEKAIELSKKAIEEYKRIVELVKAKYTQLRAAIESKYTELKKELITKYNKMKPEVVEMMTKYYDMTKEELKNLLIKVEGAYSAAKAKVTDIYESNKNKTLKAIYLEIKQLVIKHFMDQKEIIQEIIKKNANDLKTKVTVFYKDVKTSMKNTVIPEIKLELESILNQTLRNTVIMSKVIIKTYTPYAVLAKNATSKVIVAIQEEIPVVVAKVNEFMKMDLAKMKKTVDTIVAKFMEGIKEVKSLIEKEKIYEKFVTIFESPTFKKMKVEIEAIIAKIEKFVKEQIEELKKNPTIIKIEGQITEAKKILGEKLQVKIAELKKYVVEKLEELKKSPTFLKIKVKIEEKIAELKKMVTWIKTKIENIKTSKEFLKISETIKQLKESGKFTVDKLDDVLKPYLESAIKSMKVELPVIQKLISDFSENPEEIFWDTYNDYKESLIKVYNMIRSTSLKQIVDAVEKQIDAAVAFSMKLYDECTDKWTKETLAEIGSEIRALVTKLKAGYQKMKVDLPILFKKHYAETLVSLKEFARKYLSKAETLIKKQFELLKEYWETSPLKAFADTPLLGEVLEEIKDHELAKLVLEFKDMAWDQLMAAKSVIVKICKDEMIMLENKYAEIKVKAGEKYSELKAKTSELHAKIIALVTKTVKTIEETKISDIVAFVQKQYAFILEKFNTLKAQYSEKIKALYEKYEKKINEIYGKLNTKLATIKDKMDQTIKTVTKKIKEEYSKYRGIVEEAYKKMVSKINVTYNEMKINFIGKYKDITSKAKELYTKYKSMIIAQYEKLLKMWNESIVRAKLIAFSKMSIKETIEILSNAPAEIKKRITEKYGEIVAKVNQIYNEIIKKVTIEQEKIMKILQPYLTSAKDAYKWAKNEVKKTAEFVYNYYGLLEKFNKIKSFAVKEMNKMNAQIKAFMAKYKETLSSLPDRLEKSAEKYKKALEKFSEQYKAAFMKKVTECIEKCKKQIESFGKDIIQLAKISGDESLRALHASLKKIDNIEPALKKMFDTIRKNIKVTQTDGSAVIGITHLEIVPSFSHQLENIKQLPKKVLELLVQGKELAIKTITKMKGLKKELAVKIEEFKVSIQKYVEMMKKNAPIMAAKIQEKLKIYAKILEAKASEVIAKAKEVILKVRGKAAKVEEVINNIMEKLEKKLLEFKDKIANNPKFKKIVVHLEMKLNELKNTLKEKAIECKEVALKTVETLKIKGTELVEKMKAKAVVLKVTIEKYVEVVKAEATMKASEIKVVVTEYIKIIKKKAGVIIGDAKVLIKKYIKIIKEKAPVVAAKVNGAINWTVTTFKTETEKVKKMIETAAAKIEMNLKELKATINKDERYIKLAAFVDKILAELKKVLKEKVARGNEIVQKAIVKGKELMTQIEAKLNDLKITIIKRVKLVNEKAPVLLAKAKETIKIVFAKLEARLKELQQTLTNDERYIKFVAFLEKKIAELKVFVNAQVEELKKNPTFLKLKESIQTKYEHMKENIPIMLATIEKEIKITLNKSSEFIKINIPKIEKKLRELIQSINSNEMYAFLKKKITKLVKIVKEKIEELKTNPTILDIKSKGEVMIKKAAASLKKDIELLKKEIPVIIAHGKEIFNGKYNESVEYIKTIIVKLRVKFDSLKKTVLSSEEYLVLKTKLHQLKKFLEEKLEELKKTPLFSSIKELIKQIKDNTVELRLDIMKSYDANKNISLYVYNNAKVVVIKYYKQGIILYNNIAISSFEEVCSKAVEYGKSLYGSLQKQCKAVKVDIENELKTYYEALKNAQDQVKAGVPVKDVLQKMFNEIFGKIDSKVLDFSSAICKRDPALCELIKESWIIHQNLLKTYAQKIGN